MALSISIEALKKRVKAGQDISLRCVLVMIECRGDRQKVANLTTLIGIPKPSITRAIDRLEKIDTPFLRRQPDTEDRRSPWIVMTPEGKRFLNSILSE